MTFDWLGEVNWLAILVGAVAWWLLGALWYSPVLFGKPWMRATGITAGDQGPGATTYIVPLVANFVTTVVVAMLALATGSTTVGEGIVLGLLLGVGFAVALYAVEATFGQRPGPGVWFLITASYQLVGILIATVIVTVWD